MNLQWFPGHMSKTRRMISENLKLVDVVIELLDARLPLSSRNPEIDRIVDKKPRILVLNKADLADEKTTREWIAWFQKKGLVAIPLDSQSGKGFSAFAPAIDRVMKEKLERDRAKGIQRHSIRLMVVGIPNVGKSSFINRLSGRNAAKTGDRPGITQTKQWIRIAGKYELLDTPGILWPKFEDPEVAKRIAFTGGIKDEIIDVEELACLLLSYMVLENPGALLNRYKLTVDDVKGEAFTVLESIGRKRGCVVSGGNIDTLRAANLLLDDFRSGKIGNITLEIPKEEIE
ncbi:MAG: ribosome biogenesis GTPase YlqF [Clostridia bacterium]|nr:ribosome biogenesis GTPase YlqF [Clostridia bacterium]